ncbi:MAG: site-2 protease family protein [Bdellovibrionaceae bacterium]|nr:site-2 protease family protein [Pseudobdellovibrionaceae bacterium]
MEYLAKVALYFVPFLLALSFHEYAHAWMAKRKGDTTAEFLGRLSLNPTVHMDILGTVILPLVAIFFSGPFFGWAKPVPVNPRNFKDPVKDMFWVALAGPVSNFILAFLALIILVITALVFTVFLQDSASLFSAIKEFFNIFILINLFLGVFNLLPIHPLDGGKILARFLPFRWNAFLEKNQMMFNLILIYLFITGGLRVLAIPVYWMYNQMMGLVVLFI